MSRYIGVLGILAVLLAAWLGSTDRKNIRWRTVAWGLGLQLTFAFLVLRFSFGQWAMERAGGVINAMLANTQAGSATLFGQLGLPNSGAFGKLLPGTPPNMGSIFAFQVLPTIIFISAFFALLYHIGVMQIVIRAFAWVMQKTMRISGAESLNVAASVFMGQTEAPLTIRPFLAGATNSELMTIMTSGMAHVSGGIMAAYIAQGIEAKHLLAAVIMTSPGTILMAKMLVPETGHPATEGRVIMPKNEEHKDENLIGAVARGTIDGGKLAMNVGIMLISFLALVSLLNGLMAWVHGGVFWFPASIKPGSRLPVLAGRLADRRAVERRARHRQPARHAHGAQRVHRLPATGHTKSGSVEPVLHHRHFRFVRLCQPGVHRHADRRYRRAGSGAAQRSGQAGRSRHAGRHHGQPDIGFDCRNIFRVVNLHSTLNFGCPRSRFASAYSYGVTLPPLPAARSCRCAPIRGRRPESASRQHWCPMRSGRPWASIGRAAQRPDNSASLSRTS